MIQPALAFPPEPVVSSALPTSRVLGRYRLGHRLASGGMATVYLAVASDSRFVARPLALKCIHPHLVSQPGFLEMFIDEARIASRVRHPNLCGVLDFGELDGSYYMTMEYIQGEPLNKVLAVLARRDGLVNPLRRARVAAQVVADACEGLHSAHELCDEDGKPLQVVHRDVSPSNLIVSYDGLTRVVDFGVASAAGCMHDTHTGSIKGKLGYMSPGQFNGERPDRTVDLWALGVVLWEAVALRSLFRRENHARTINALLKGEIPSVHPGTPELGELLDPIIARATSQSSTVRYATGLEMAADLQRFLAASGAPAARTELSELMAELFPGGEEEKRRLIKDMLSQCSARGTRGPHRLRAAPSDGGGADAAKAVLARTTSHILRIALSTRMLALVTASLCLAIGLALASRSEDPPRAARAKPSFVAVPPPPELTRALLPCTQPACDEATPATELQVPAAADAELLDKLEHSRTLPVRAAHHSGSRKRVQKGEPPATQQEGLVSVATSGDWAEIYHQGRLLGPTPARITLPVGRQVLSLHPGSGGPPHRLAVVVSAGALVRVRADL